MNEVCLFLKKAKDKNTKEATLKAKSKDYETNP
jgi:hypothetical protein